ncbi:Coupling of ubiquitin conjugation to ER degradation protein 1 [Hypsizygus marmoreus]|uniref:Coupling of ubiquitin conjugation to ER degradation protein 1 n=1 Tax=Hypsizygus marmoreus TaxID=39966 RepID=A0A369JZH7_HYPMA|nr:Coupling of ubiquitin conjugation to ER degradation protein 1 [Hypsizygus marmoreus]
MIDTVSNMFPDIPVDNVRYDLLRTGSVEITTNRILERGFLDAPPPAYYTLFPRSTTSNATPNASAQKKPPTETLISRYGLQERVEEVGEKEIEEVGGKAAWEDSPEKREASLRERKAKMILAARQRMLAQQQKGKQQGPGES